MNRWNLEFKGSMFESYLAATISKQLPECKIILNKEVFSYFLNDVTQIDVIIISDNNVYVIEAKNWSSYIKGEYNDKHWKGKGDSQAMSVFNPINQNAIHIRALIKSLYDKGCKNLIHFKSLIVVPDSCQLLTNCSEVCTISELNHIIKTLDGAEESIDKEYYYRIITEI